ncbi:methylenetetrahydrofolate reductase (NADPH)-like [Musca vetustissima]|uniref:methylenetetrahydrofolate reductase (NADPH)-like n=1 Tax=Musca vetustissima TaxID=27455 RepID=UPI002AB6C176|nr:methylenetetrahydrofolate reductase (NADPH)-like [Musca vetustissima]
MSFDAIKHRIFTLIIPVCVFSTLSASTSIGSCRGVVRSADRITNLRQNTQQLKDPTQQMQKNKQLTTTMSIQNNNMTMQSLGPTPAQGAHVLPAPKTATKYYEMNVAFTEQQTPPFENEMPKTAADQRLLRNVINEKIRNKEFFYGIEILARTYNPNVLLDYNALGPLLPLFTSIVWLGMDYCNIENLTEIEAIRLAHKLNRHVRVMPHLSCYCLTEQRLREFLQIDFSNVLSIRGDYFDKDQQYQHSSELVEAIRRIRGDSISIGVAGYPEGHPECKSMDEDMGNLETKVQSGADFIITQICFSSQPIIDFIKNCRSRNIKIPILVGIFVPDNLRMLETILRITKIQMPLGDLEEYRRQNDLGEGQFTEYAVKKAVEMIDVILSSDEVDVYGLQFFTMNRFQNIPLVLEKIRNK